MGRGSGVVVIHFGVGVLAFLGQMGREVVMMMTVMTERFPREKDKSNG